jgi:hypothetical protein
MTSRPEVYIKKAEQDSASGSSLLRFPNKPYPHSMLMVFESYNYSGFGSTSGTGAGTYSNPLTALNTDNRRSSGVGLRSVNSIELPFPRQLQDQTTLLINGFSRDPTVEGLTTAIQGMIDGSGNGSAVLSDLPKALQQAGMNFASALASGGSGSVTETLKSLATAAGAVGVSDAATMSQYLLRKFVPGDLAKSVNLATGQVLNPRETLAFEGVGLRQHNFNWELYPNSEADSSQIAKIVKKLKSFVLPVTQDLGSGQNAIGKAFLRYPHIVKIYLIGVNEEHFMKFKPAMVTTMSVDYGAGGGVSMMKGGKPAGVTLTMSLQELQIETAEDYGAASADAQDTPPLPEAAEQE